jgi:hypothetical protein
MGCLSDKTYAKDAYGVPSIFLLLVRSKLPQKRVGRRVAVLCYLKTVLNFEYCPIIIDDDSRIRDRFHPLVPGG